MPDVFSFDLKQLVRVCLNDPDMRAQVEAALEEGPLPVRTPLANVTDDKRVFAALVRSDRDRSPGEAGFLARDQHGWVSGRLEEVVVTEHDASTMSADEMAAKLGITVEELATRLKPH